MHQTLRDILTTNPIVPVYTPHSVEETVATAKRLVAEGTKCIEITLRTDAAMDAIKAVKAEQENGLDIVLGVGTISNATTVKQLKKIGVDFGVSPGLTKNILKAALKHNFPLLPGIATPSELLTGLEYGFETFKLFPANAINSKALLKAFNATYPHVRFCPTGGVNAENKDEFLAMPNVIAAGGSWVFK